MIEITAKLVRGPVYFNWEEITCYVTFKNVSMKDCINVSRTTNELDNLSINSTSSSGNGDHIQQQQSVTNTQTSDVTEILALAGAQLYCHCSIDESKVKFIPPELSSDAIDTLDTISLASNSSTSAITSSSYVSSSGTSFNPSKSERGYVIYNSAPKILFCMLQLAPNDSKTFVFSERLPKGSPPSYYGNAIKYLYKLTIGTQRVGSVMQLLRIPIRILSFDLLPDASNSASKNNSNGSKSLSTQSSMISEFGDHGSELDLILHKLDNLTSRKNCCEFIISQNCQKVAKFNLLKTAFKLGEDIIGSFDFSDAIIPCVSFIVTLQSEECISSDSIRSCAKELKGSPKDGVIITNHSSVEEYVLQTSNTHIVLPIPLTVTPGFSTNIVALIWRLHFEFIITKTDELIQVETSDVQGTMVKQPESIHVNTMFWDLPITIYPNNPTIISRGLQLPALSTLVS